MINRIFQNMPGSLKYSHGGNDGVGFLSTGRGDGAVERLFHRLRAWLVAIDRERAVEYEHEKAIAHLRSLTDSQLRDIGIARPDIERAVRQGRDAV